MIKTTKPKLIFYGGVGSSTGANVMLQFNGKKILIDCGLKQGEKFAEQENFEPFVYDPASVDFLLVTHAHIDHTGRIPKLVRAGFRGKIISTKETMELAYPMLEDALKVLKMRHQKILFEREDLDKSFELWEGFEYKEKIKLTEDCSVEMIDAGHILGSSIINVVCRSRNEEIKLSFTGDLGNSPSPLLKDTEIPLDTNYLIMESVYGDRNHDSKDRRREELKQIILESQNKGGTIIIPAFSVERTQVLLYEINNLVEEGEISPIPVFIDSPLALKVTEIYRKHPNDFNNRVVNQIKKGDKIFDFKGLEMVTDPKESLKIEKINGAKIIMAGSGMSEGGRVVNHEANFLGDPNATILLVGYQSIGSLGRQLQDGQKFVYIEADGDKSNGKEKIEVRAKIKSIMGYSSHKDSDHLLEFVEQVANHSSQPSFPTKKGLKSKTNLRKVFVIMGEPKASLFLCQRIRDYLDLEAIYPEPNKEYQLG